MAHAVIPHFANDGGLSRILIGAREFMCEGASAPFDHPHVYLDMGGDIEKICPYCSTVYVFDAALPADETVPPGCLVAEPAAA